MEYQKGLANFELAVIAVLVGLAGLVFVAVEAQSERYAVALAIRNMRTGLQLAMAEKLMHGEDAQFGALAARSPLEFIGQPDGKGGGARGDWKFDAGSRDLVYRPTLRLAFEGRKEFRWRIEGIVDTRGKISGLRLVEIAPGQLGR